MHWSTHGVSSGRCNTTSPQMQQPGRQEDIMWKSKCVYPSWTFAKAGKAPEERSGRFTREERRKPPKQQPLVSAVSEQLRCTSTAFKPQNTACQKLVVPKDPVLQHKQTNIVSCPRRMFMNNGKPNNHWLSRWHRRADLSGRDFYFCL